MKTKKQWVYLRDGEVKGIFANRKEVVKYFKEVLKQTLKDFDNQDKTDEFDYLIIIPFQEFKPMDIRPASFGLLG